MKIGENLRVRRIAKGYTQEELSKKSGVSRVTISKLENGSQSVTTNTTLILLSKALDCSVAYFFEGKVKQA